MQGINLIPLKIQAGWRRRQIRVFFYLVVVIYCIAAGSLYYTLHSAVISKNAELASLEQQKIAIELKSTEFQRLTSQLAGINNDEKELKRRLDLASGLTKDRVLWSNVLKHMSNDIPKGVWLKSITTSDTIKNAANPDVKVKQIRLLGSGLSNSAVSDMIFTLENSGYLKDVQLAYTQKKELEAGIVFDFEIKVVLKKGIEGIYGW